MNSIISLIFFIVLTESFAFTPALQLSRRITALNDAINDIASGDELGTSDPNSVGALRGCEISRPNADNNPTDYEISIDGVEADLGRFSEQVYKKVMMDAKQQQFQGFRPGTVPPHLQNTYKTFAMDETGRETIMEAMTQNKVQPFERTREEIKFTKVSFIPPPSKKKKKKKSKKKTALPDDEVEDAPPVPSALSFESMDDAVKNGWAPGIPFSFTSTCKGQPAGMDVLSTSGRTDAMSKMYPTDRS
ncbi:hypothetical protein TrST_g10205 [Triparma strigata]|uniref:Trigger factor ribosome-binding bacterial domain-containing protein n=1 Tax=Triparma strigata TaxID=1606541 RepID=A0A9W7E2X4_9STRA|nr:hypothetical protein TrST_g10205 [Triparma strigata]